MCIRDSKKSPSILFIIYKGFCFSNKKELLSYKIAAFFLFFSAFWNTPDIQSPSTNEVSFTQKIIEIVWLSLHPSLPFFTVKEDFFAQNFLPIPQPSPSLTYDPKHSKNRFFRAKKQQASQKEVFFCSKWRFFQAKIAKESISPHEKNCFLGWKNLLYPTKETALSHEKNCFSTYINKSKK